MTYTKLTIETQELVAYQTIKSGMDSIAKRADRKLKPIAISVYNRLTKKQRFSDESNVIADYRFENKDKARTITEGVKEFKQRYPEYGTILQGIIDETRKTKKRYLNFGLVTGEKLGEELYAGALKSIGIPDEKIDSTLQTVMEISDLLLTSKEKGLTEMLIK